RSGPVPAACQKIFASGRWTNIPLLARRRIDSGRDFRHTRDREAALRAVRADQVLTGRDVDAVKPVAGDVALEPLNPGAELAQHLVRLPRRRLQLLGRPGSDTGNLTLDHVLGHRQSSGEWGHATGGPHTPSGVAALYASHRAVAAAWRRSSYR